MCVGNAGEPEARVARAGSRTKHQSLPPRSSAGRTRAAQGGRGWMAAGQQAFPAGQQAFPVGQQAFPVGQHRYRSSPTPTHKPAAHLKPQTGLGRRADHVQAAPPFTRSSRYAWRVQGAKSRRPTRGKRGRARLAGRAHRCKQLEGRTRRAPGQLRGRWVLQGQQQLVASDHQQYVSRQALIRSRTWAP